MPLKSTSKENRNWPVSLSTAADWSLHSEVPEPCQKMVMVPSPLSTILWSGLLAVKWCVYVPPVSKVREHVRAVERLAEVGEDVDRRAG